MKKRFLILAIFSFFLFNGLGDKEYVTASPTPAPTNFDGETLEYGISWQKMINAGNATLSIKKEGGRYQLKTVARSANWLKYLGIKIKDTITAEAHGDLSRSYWFEADIHEGSFKKKKRIQFDHENGEIIYTDNNKPPRTFPLSERTFDVLSALYLVRQGDFTKGEVEAQIFDDKKWYRAKTEILGKELVKIEGRELEAYKTQVHLKTSGVFNRKGNLYIWFSADERKVPLIVKSKIALGAFYATLKNPYVI